MRKVATMLVAVALALGLSPAFAADDHGDSEVGRLVPGTALEEEELAGFFGRGTVSTTTEGSMESAGSGEVDLRLLMRIRHAPRRSSVGVPQIDVARPGTLSGRNAARSTFGGRLPDLGKLLELEKEFAFSFSLNP